MLQPPAGDDRCPGGLAADADGDPAVLSSTIAISSIGLINLINVIKGADLQHERRLRSRDDGSAVKGRCCGEMP